MKIFISIMLLTFCILSMNAQDKKVNSKELPKASPITTVNKNENSEIKTIDKSLDIKELKEEDVEIESPQKGEPVIGAEVFVEQEPVQNQPAAKPKIKKNNKSQAKKEEGN